MDKVGCVSPSEDILHDHKRLADSLPALRGVMVHHFTVMLLVRDVLREKPLLRADRLADERDQ